ncbi:MAG: DMT family transporter [Oscillospiraceae bacterium]
MKKEYICGLTTVLIWATMAAMVKGLLTEIPQLETLSVSGAFAFAFLLLVNIQKGNLKKFRQFALKDFAAMAGLGFIGLFLYSALYYYGLSQLSSQEACILNYLWPIMLVLFSAILLREKLTPVKIAAMLCSFVGVILLTSGSGASPDGNRLLGIVSCILAAVCYGLFSVLNKKADYDQDITMMVIWLTVAVCAALLGAVTETWVPITGGQWLGILWLGVVIDAVAYLLWALALKGTDNTAAIANLAYLTPFLSLIVSAVFLHEKLYARTVIALLFIVGGILLQNLPRRRTSNRTRQKNP